MSVALLEQLLEHRHGVRLDPLTQGRLARALEEEGAATGALPAAAAGAIATDPVRLQQLIDRLTLQETAFFRDPDAFADLSGRLLPALLEAAGSGRVVVWSAGCANGQEAWSLAMLLREHGVEDFEVVATDVSARAVARARAGVYHARELRGLGATRRLRFLERAGEHWRVTGELRRHVRVAHQNAATDRPPIADGSCALVLCRYVLIYLTPSAADALLARIATTLRPEGRLLIGAAESLWHLSERFTLEGLPRSMAYRARPADRPVRAGAPHRPAAPPRSRPEDDAAHRTPRFAPEPPPRGLELVQAGEAAAARGELHAAVAAFRGAAYLDPDDAVALVRLGLVLEALADPGAQRAFRAARGAVERRPGTQLGEALGGFAPAALRALLDDKLGVPS